MTTISILVVIIIVFLAAILFLLHHLLRRPANVSILTSTCNYVIMTDQDRPLPASDQGRRRRRQTPSEPSKHES